MCLILTISDCCGEYSSYWVDKPLEFYHTLKHTVWLNIIEIEISILRSERLDCGINDKQIQIDA
jgi:hypothetical protein